jgi:hypothetical protein
MEVIPLTFNKFSAHVSTATCSLPQGTAIFKEKFIVVM